MPLRAASAIDLDELLTPAEVAGLTKLSVSTLKDKRWRGTGPTYTKLSPGRGGRVRYRRRDVEAWMNGEQIASAA
ncbi:helix-turn-helix domain-containing protein [Streptomyces sp. CB03911]|uniref:helix-turn-helix transcriptional regulator n=1 Tax=Streptomyces sp. CB03911 TaxID=1804758 RepID=UPI00093C83D3|nr:helix-turn-helix domain-containing protein [Streptomyces sp. CB03911]